MAEVTLRFVQTLRGCADSRFALFLHGIELGFSRPLFSSSSSSSSARKKGGSTAVQQETKPNLPRPGKKTKMRRLRVQLPWPWRLPDPHRLLHLSRRLHASANSAGSRAGAGQGIHPSIPPPTTLMLAADSAPPPPPIAFPRRGRESANATLLLVFGPCSDRCGFCSSGLDASRGFCTAAAHRVPAALPFWASIVI